MSIQTIFDNINEFSAGDFATVFRNLYENGVICPSGETTIATTALKVTNSSGNASIGNGSALIKGRVVTIFGETVTLETDGTYKIVLEWSAAADSSQLIALPGSETLVQTDTQYQLLLATVVKSGTSLAVTDGRIFINKLSGNTALSIQSVPVAPTAPTDGQMLICKDGKYEPGKIIDSSSNANGSFIKFSDGTMICKTYVASQTTDSTGRATWTFPAAFVTGEIPTVTVSPVASLSATQNAIIGTTPTPTAVVFLHTINGAAINAQTVRYCATAIGKWK